MPQVKLLGLLRLAAGTASLSVPAASVQEVLATVAQHRVGLSRLLFPGAGERLSGDLRVLVNGRDTAFLQGLDTPVAPDDTVTLFYHGARGFPGG